MNEAHQPVRHLDKIMTWHLAVPLWLSSTGILFVTAILSVIGLLLNAFSVGSSNRTLSFAAFDSPAPSSVIIFIILAAAWQFCAIGWCALAASPFKRTFREVYIWSAILTAVLIAAAYAWFATTHTPAAAPTEIAEMR